MATESTTALFQIVTAANMAGVAEAKTGFLGLNASTLALGAALGGVILVGKAAIDNTEAMNAAHLSLRQAVGSNVEGFDILQTAFDKWAEANKRYIPDQYAAETALAAFVRTGVSYRIALEEMNIALDLSTLKGTDMATAQTTLVSALAGASKGLKAIGITTDEYNAIMKDKLLTTEQKQVALLALIETHTANGRKAQTDLTQSTQAMNKDWQDLTTKIGPPLLQLLTFVADKADQLVQALSNLGANKDWNKWISAGLGIIQGEITGVVGDFEKLLQAVDWLNQQGANIKNYLGSGGSGSSYVPPHRASGGPVSAGQSYLVGERGPELFTPGSGGNISPHGAGGMTVNVHIGMLIGDNASKDRLINELAQRLQYVTGR